MKVNKTKIMFSRGNQMSWYLWLYTLMVVLLLSSLIPCHAEIAYYNLFVVLGEDNPGKIYQLKVYPNGQILDTFIQYTVGGDTVGGGGFETGQLIVSNNYTFLMTSIGSAIYRYQIQANGNLFGLGSTLLLPQTAAGLEITPTGPLVITEPAYGNGTIFSLTTSGNLINGTSCPAFYVPKADPLGRGILSGGSSYTFSAYTINYVSTTLNLTTTYSIGTGAVPFGFNYTPDGKLGFMYGFLNSSNALWVMKIDSAFNIITTQSFYISGLALYDLAVSIDNKYIWGVTAGGFIELFTISTTGVVTDTHEKIYVLDSTIGFPLFQKNTPEGRLAIVEYDDESLDPEGGSFATAIIAGDGSLLWTGYTFAFDSAHPSPGTIVDYVIVPVYVTAVPYEFWKDLDDNK